MTKVKASNFHVRSRFTWTILAGAVILALCYTYIFVELPQNEPRLFFAVLFLAMIATQGYCVSLRLELDGDRIIARQWFTRRKEIQIKDVRYYMTGWYGYKGLMVEFENGEVVVIPATTPSFLAVTDAVIKTVEAVALPADQSPPGSGIRKKFSFGYRMLGVSLWVNTLLVMSVVGFLVSSELKENAATPDLWVASVCFALGCGVFLIGCRYWRKGTRIKNGLEKPPISANKADRFVIKILHGRAVLGEEERRSA